MQYIKKLSTPPPSWNEWFTKATGLRSFDYGRDFESLTNLGIARRYLVEEQSNLCAYCQCALSLGNSAIEHVVPKSLNNECSTSYYNLVAVCKPTVKDENGRLYCDKAKEDRPITPLIFMANSAVFTNSNSMYFYATADGHISAAHSLADSIKKQVEAFIEILNLNHPVPRQNRVDMLNGMLEIFHSLTPHQKNTFWRVQFDRIQRDKTQPYRQFLLIYIGHKLGIH